MIRLLAAVWCIAWAGGCAYLPEISRQPTVQNPFPQLSRVAVAPFFNLSTEPSVEGRQVALAYFNELQTIPGFEVIPIGVVEETLKDYQLNLSSGAEVRKLAQILGVDAVVVGAITDFSPYYPPRMALQVDWYAANPYYHPIPPGYGLPWGTPAEEEIPGPLVFEAEMALAKAQMKTQTPAYEEPIHLMPPPTRAPEQDLPGPRSDSTPGGQQLSHKTATATSGADKSAPVVTTGAETGGLPADWPDPRGFTPPPPGPAPAACQESQEPVLSHTKTYNGHDSDVTTALASYVYFRDDARFGGWQSYLQRSDDFIRFCCHMHISEMLTARGGAGETRVVWRWPTSR